MTLSRTHRPTNMTTPAQASPVITGVDFVTLPANDIEASRHFYGTVLGLPFVKNYGDMPASEYQAGNLTLAIMEPDAFGQEFRPHARPSRCRSTTSPPRARRSRRRASSS